MLRSLQLMAPSETEHMEVCFDLYDLDGSGSLTRDGVHAAQHAMQLCRPVFSMGALFVAVMRPPDFAHVDERSAEHA